jgi:sec-independent protein translocase protein TatA
MMNIGAGEILMIAVLALLIFGPRRLPEIGKQAAKALREFRRAANELTSELKSDLNANSTNSTSSTSSTSSTNSSNSKPAERKEQRPGPRG